MKLIWENFIIELSDLDLLSISILSVEYHWILISSK